MAHVFIRAEAEADIAEAYRYYQSCRSGLGDELLLSIEAALSTIERQPELYACVHRQVRRAFIHRFPYGVFYIVDRNNIVVLAVLHVRRSPQHWRERIN